MITYHDENPLTTTDLDSGSPDDEQVLSSPDDEQAAATFRHECRPVHPQCAKLSNVYARCTCPLLWGYEVDIRRLRDIYKRLDMRTKYGRNIGRGMGPGPDREDYSPYGPAEKGPHAAEETDSYASTDELEATGFWKEGNFLDQFVDMPTLDSKLGVDKQDV